MKKLLFAAAALALLVCAGYGVSAQGSGFDGSRSGSDSACCCLGGACRNVCKNCCDAGKVCRDACKNCCDACKTCCGSGKACCDTSKVCCGSGKTCRNAGRP